MKMTKYRKKPVVIEATQWFKNGDHPEDRWSPEVQGRVVRYYRTPELDGQTSCTKCGAIMHIHGWVDTLESGGLAGGYIVCPGDWIITGVKGERYPCKPDIFEETYEAV